MTELQVISSLRVEMPAILRRENVIRLHLQSSESVQGREVGLVGRSMSMFKGYRIKLYDLSQGTAYSGMLSAEKTSRVQGSEIGGLVSSCDASRTRDS